MRYEVRYEVGLTSHGTANLQRPRTGADPLAFCEECGGGGSWCDPHGSGTCPRCHGSGLEGGRRALGWLRRRLNALVELLALTRPEDEGADCRRADGNCICPRCGATYYEHACDPRNRFLRALCDGRRRVKL